MVWKYRLEKSVMWCGGAWAVWCCDVWWDTEWQVRGKSSRMCIVYATNKRVCWRYVYLYSLSLENFLHSGIISASTYLSAQSKFASIAFHEHCRFHMKYNFKCWNVDVVYYLIIYFIAYLTIYSRKVVSFHLCYSYESSMPI